MTSTTGILHVDWDEATGETYEFSYRDTKGNQNKAVYYGHFQRTAPGSLRPGEEVCLKFFQLAPDSGDQRVPQERELFDLMDLHGDHLRQILIRNPAAQDVADQLAQGVEQICLPEQTACYSVEPLYNTLDKVVRNPDTLSGWDRLEVLRQYALGLEELTGEENAVMHSQITAHRDVKLENAVLEFLGPGAFRIRLIDFATIGLEHHSMGTIKGPKSFQNTAPESIGFRNFPVTGRTDVYALGMLLASLFVRVSARDKKGGGYMNPNMLLCQEAKPPAVSTMDAWQLWQKRMKELLKDALRKDNDSGYGDLRSWIEVLFEEKGYQFEWENPQEPVMVLIRMLFIDAVHINPASRLSLKEFLLRIEQIQADCTQKQSGSPLLYGTAAEAEVPTAEVLLVAEEGFGACKSGYRDRLLEEFDSYFSGDSQLLCFHYCGDSCSGCTVCTSGLQLKAFLEQIPRDRPESDRSLLARPLYRMLQELHSRSGSVAFNGRLHLCMPEFRPVKEDTITFSATGTTLGVPDLLRILRKDFLQDRLDISVYSRKDRIPEEKRFYRWVALDDSRRAERSRLTIEIHGKTYYM